MLGCFRLFNFLFTGFLFSSFICAWVYILQPNKSLIFFLISILGNYFLTAWVSMNLISYKKKSNLFTNLYLFSFLFLPFISLMLYFSLGSDYLDKKTINNYKKQLKNYQKYQNFNYTNKLLQTNTLKSAKNIFLYNYSKHQHPILENNEFTILQTAREHILSLIDLIKNAKKFIHMEYYIFSDGYVLNYLLILFEQKIKSGVEVKLIIDDWGSYWTLKKTTRKKMIKMGIQFKVFNPIFKSNNFWWQFRNHNKILVVDNESAIYGSCNISDEYFNITSHFFQTTEISSLIRGDIVNSLNILFCVHWNMYKTKYHFQEFDILLQKIDYFKSLEKKYDEINVQLIDSSPLMEEQIIKNNLIQLIHEAKKSIIISTPYFYPPKDLVNALKLVSISGISVKILVPKQADFKNFFLNLHRQLFFELLSSNIEIYEYFGFNHEKITIIDENIVYFGTYNWDYRSLYLNFESALLIESKICAQTLKKIMNKQFNNSHLIQISDLEMSNNLFLSLGNIFTNLFKPFL